MSAAKKRPGVGIDFTGLPPLGNKPAGTAPALQARPATGVGLMSVAVAGARELQADNVRLQAQVQQLEGERGAQLLDAKTVRPSRWANRHESSFASPEFAALKAEIADAGGNVQPVKVRPLQQPTGLDGARYELVFGHRRHRACLELGLPVLAVVADVDERGLWVEMERENRNREGLSAWEQGMNYKRALDAGLFPSLRMLAQAAGLNPATVSKTLTVANLPERVVAAFPTPGDIQHKWASELRAAVERNEAAVLAAADAVEHGTPAVQVFARLTAVGVAPGNNPTRRVGVAQGNTTAAAVGTGASAPSRLDLGHGRFADVRIESGRAVIELDAAQLDAQAWEAVKKALRNALRKHH